MQRKYLRLGVAAATLAALAGVTGSVSASGLLRTVVSGLSAPLYVTNASDARLFVVERPGRIRVYAGGALLATPLLDISSKTTTDGERGLLSVAFHPDFASNGYFFVDYTNTAGNIVVERYRITGDPRTSNVADPTSAATLLVIPHPTNNNHNGGQLQIGPTDGYLYIGTGDGGGAGDTPCNAERTDVLLGKILRVDVRQNLNTTPFYGIPPSNPFVGSGDPGGQVPDEIWAIGLRNPWRFSFDRVNGDMYIGDVGQDSFEEVDVQKTGTAAGRNYGWKSDGGPPLLLHDELSGERSGLQLAGAHAARPRIPARHGRLFRHRRVSLPRIGRPRAHRQVRLRRLLLRQHAHVDGDHPRHLADAAVRVGPDRAHLLRRRSERRALRDGGQRRRTDRVDDDGAHRELRSVAFGAHLRARARGCAGRAKAFARLTARCWQSRRSRLTRRRAMQADPAPTRSVCGAGRR